MQTMQAHEKKHVCTRFIGSAKELMQNRENKMSIPPPLPTRHCYQKKEMRRRETGAWQVMMELKITDATASHDFAALSVKN